MKKIRVIALAMAMLVLALSAVACSSEKVSVNCKVSIKVGDETYLEDYEYTVENKAETPPTVLQAVSEVLTIVEYPYTLDDSGTKFASITVDGTEYPVGMLPDGSGIGFWEYTVDGAAPEAGGPGVNAVQEGQHIVYTYSFTPMEITEFSSGEE